MILACHLLSQIVSKYYPDFTLETLANIATVAGGIGVVYAIADYYGRKTSSRRHVLLVLFHALNISSDWAQYNRGGIKRSERKKILEDTRRSWCNPFWSVNRIDNSMLQNIWTLAGIGELDEWAIERIARLNQLIANFNSYIEGVDGFKRTIPPEMAVSIHLKLNGAIKSDLTVKEQFIATKLREHWDTLHFDRIGDEASGGLYQSHKELFDWVKHQLGR